MEYWYKYRFDLWKCVTLNDFKECQTYHPRTVTAEEKLKNNIRRAAVKIEGYALCNDWDWFGTFTLNPEYRDRADLDGFRRDFMQFIRNCRRTYGDIDALMVPELHRRGDGWHMHALLNGPPVDALRRFTLKEKLPKYIRDCLKDGKTLYDWPAYRDSFGWVDIEPVRSRDAAARYITKYITKGWNGDECNTSTPKAIGLGKHLYYVTRGLALPERMENAPGCLPDAFPASLVPGRSYDFDYGTVQWYELPHKL